MPKIVVVVDKDDTGKLWNYVSTEEELVRNQGSFGTGPLWIHKPEPPEETSRVARPTELAAEDKVTLGVLPPHEEARARQESKRNHLSSRAQTRIRESAAKTSKNSVYTISAPLIEHCQVSRQA